MHGLVLKIAEKIVIDTTFNFDHVVNIVTDVAIEGNTATFDVSAGGGVIGIDVFAAVTDEGSYINGQVTAAS